jgi:hypothetical protein
MLTATVTAPALLSCSSTSSSSRSPSRLLLSLLAPPVDMLGDDARGMRRARSTLMLNGANTGRRRAGELCTVCWVRMRVCIVDTLTLPRSIPQVRCPTTRNTAHFSHTTMRTYCGDMMLAHRSFEIVDRRRVQVDEKQLHRRHRHGDAIDVRTVDH